jgi:hypothetical protein
MDFLVELWLPIILSAVAVFIVSSIIHMATPWHKGDMKRLPEEATVLAALTKVPSGDYRFPFAECMKEMGSPEIIEKFRTGPSGSMTIIPRGVPTIGKSLMQWFTLSLVISVFVAYITHLSRVPGEGFKSVLQVAGATGVLGYAFGSTCDSIWKGVSWDSTMRFTVDGIIYGIVTGATFAWMWPSMV